MSLEFVRSEGTGHLATSYVGLPDATKFLDDHLSGKPPVRGCGAKNVTYTGVDPNALGPASAPILTVLEELLVATVGLNDSIWIADTLAEVQSAA
jgi:hypothetical protein